MDDGAYIEHRRRVLRGGEIPDAVYEELRDVVARLVRRRTLPPSFAPYGVWNDEAVDEVLSAWMVRRLIGLGHLRPLVARAGDLRVFRARAERSLRQFLMNERERSQAENLFLRLRALLEDEEAFRCFVESTRSQHRWWGLAEWDAPEPFSGSERMLHGAAWAAGDLHIIRYRADAKKLSPLLDLPELRRFAVVVFETIDALLTVPMLIDALSARVDLDDARILPFSSADDPALSSSSADDLGMRELAEFACSELTARQAEILRATAAERPLADIGSELGCSAATVLNEQRRVGTLLTRLTADEGERTALLTLVVDLLYESGDQDA